MPRRKRVPATPEQTRDWLKKAVKLYGNYGEIYDKNLGQESPLKLQRNRSRLIKDGGMLKSQAFL